jgi:hypothetical protein
MIDFNLTNQEILDDLLTTVKIPTGKKMRFEDIETAFPDKGYRRLVASTVQSVAKIDVEAQIVFNAASNGGANLSSDSAQKQVQQIAFSAKWPQELTNFILSYSLWTGPKWQHLGLQQPTLDWIQSEREKKQSELDQDKRREEYNTLRESWIVSYQRMLSWINQQEQNNKPTPTLNEVIDQLRS